MAFWKWFSHPQYTQMTERRKMGGFETYQLQTFRCLLRTLLRSWLCQISLTFLLANKLLL